VRHGGTHFGTIQNIEPHYLVVRFGKNWDKNRRKEVPGKDAGVCGATQLLKHVRLRLLEILDVFETN
jgi:hypothetical protein